MKHIFVISGPSGVGKTTVINYVLRHLSDIRLSVSCTTRAPRKLESNGQDYYFLDQDEFQNHIKQNDFIEYTNIFGNSYGTLKSEVYNILDQFSACILDIDFAGAFNVLERCVIQYSKPVKTIGILILPPSFYILRKRLIQRGSETQDSIRSRLQSFHPVQINYYEPMYDYVIINNDIYCCKKLVLKIVASACGLERNILPIC